MNFDRPLLVFLIALVLVDYGCGSYEYRNRPDNSEVAVIRNIQNVFPEFATEVIGILDGFKLKEGLPETSLGHGEIKTKIVQLYDKKDQLNSQLRDFVVARYQSYINVELDPNEAARERGRKSWNQVIEKIQTTALELRKLKQSLDEKVQANADAKEKFRNVKQTKAQSKIELIDAGSAIKVYVAKTAEPRSNPFAYKVVVAKDRLDEAIKMEELPRIRVEVKTMEDGVYELWNLRDFDTKEPMPEEVREKVEKAREIEENSTPRRNILSDLSMNRMSSRSELIRLNKN